MYVKKIGVCCEKSPGKKINSSKELNDIFDEKLKISKCTSCRSLVKTTYQSNFKNSNFTEIDLPEQSGYLHLNKDILYKDSPELEKYSDKNFLLVGVGGFHRYKLIKNIRSLSFNRLVLLNSTKSMFDEYFDDVILAEHEHLSEKEKTLKAVVKYMVDNQLKFHAVFAFDEDFVMMTSYLATELKLLGIPFNLIQKIKNKSEFRKLCSELGITCPRNFLIDLSSKLAYSEQVSDFFDYESDSVISPDKNYKCQLPVIVKASFGCGKGKFVY